MKTKTMFETVVAFLIFLACTPIIVTETQNTLVVADDPNTEWNFTGASGAVTLLGLAPFIWIAAGLSGIFITLLIYIRGKGKGED